MSSKRRKNSKKGNAPFRHKKSLGQNFLCDEAIIESIVDSTEADERTLVVEIGPGQGALTSRLVERAGRVAAVELDDRLIPILHTMFALHDNFRLIHEDILKVDLAVLTEEEMREHDLDRLAVVGNLPYYITTPIIMHLLEAGIPYESITVMMQKEVGERLLAEPGTREAGAITHAVHYYCEVSKVCDVPRTAFDPAPKVDSMVLRLDRREHPPIDIQDTEHYFRCVKAGFALRRKTLPNALAAMEGVTREQIARALEEAHIDANRRAETLSMEEFARLANSLREE